MPNFEVASVVTEFPTGRNVDTSQPSEVISFDWAEITVLAVKMMQNGPWFMSHEVRTEEQAWTVARDVLIALEMLGFKVDAIEEQPPPEEAPPGMIRSTNVGVSRQAGNSR